MLKVGAKRRKFVLLFLKMGYNGRKKRQNRGKNRSNYAETGRFTDLFFTPGGRFWLKYLPSFRLDPVVLLRSANVIKETQ